jgi:hypothetical protein
VLEYSVAYTYCPDEEHATELKAVPEVDVVTRFHVTPPSEDIYNVEEAEVETVIYT